MALLRKHFIAILLGILLVHVFGLLKMVAIRPALSDENIYFYQSLRISQGKLPYRDFFYANPPGLLVPGAVVCLFFGNRFGPLKVLPSAAALGVVVVTYTLIVRRRHPLTAFLVVSACMVSGSFLRAGSHWTGINTTMFLIFLGLLLLDTRRPLAAGAILAAAGLTKTYGLVALPAFLVVAGLQERRSLARFLVSFAALTLAGYGLSFLLGGREFLEQAILYHFRKPMRAGAFGSSLEALIVQCKPWLTTALFGALLFGAGVRSKAKEDPLPTGCWVFVISIFIFLLTQKRVFIFYFLPAFPALALVLADSIGCLGGMAGGRLSGFAGSSDLPRVLSWAAGVVIRPIEMFLGLFRRLETGAGISFGTAGIARGKVHLPVSLLLILPIMLSRPGVRSYIIHETEYSFPESYEIADYLKRNLEPGETVFGHSGIAPLVALLAGCRVAADEADTNAMRFTSGTDNVLQVLKRARQDRLRYIIALVKPSRNRAARHYYPTGVFTIPEFRDAVTAEYSSVKTWNSKKGKYVLYEIQDR